MDEILDRYREALKAGHLALRTGSLDEALRWYRNAAAIADHRPVPHTSIGDVMLRMGRVDDSLVAYSRALDRAPGDAAALNGRARALFSAGRPAEAALDLEGLAAVQASQGDRAAAIATLSRALKLEGGHQRERLLRDLRRG
ncbi:MAG: tetratricopeptide repeat protein, partial [Chloroflexi bacterium]|nr:tetratricopeptide repeat protein [Chloroflexota bacterium]